MSKFLVTGEAKLRGEISVAGNKNSALKLMAACLLGNSKTVLTNVPVIRDIQVMGEIIQNLGAKVEGLGTNEVSIDSSNLSSYTLDPALSSRIRASVVLAAPLLVKFGKAIITPPGGDQIGERLLDTHFSMMRELGVQIETRDGKFFFKWNNRKKSKNIFLEEASVTATEMALMLASCLEEEITIDNAASEPHVDDLAKMLNKMGAKIDGGGSNRLRIKGNKILTGVNHKVVSDHIEAGTFAIASAITDGHIAIKNIDPNHYHIILHHLNSLGVKTKLYNDVLEVLPSKLVAVKKKFKAQPWPGFPTDLMSPFIVLASQTQGTVLCHDWMYEWRIFFVDDLISMGANIIIADPHRVIITGPASLRAQNLYCKDIRAGMSIILAALCAKGTSEIDNIEMVDRGYEKLEKRLQSLGAEVKRVDEKEGKS